MQNQIGGPGITLPVPQALYPYPLQNGSQQSPTNEISLASGQSVLIPPGEFNIDLGRYCILQYQDPVNYPSIAQNVGVWRTLRTARGTFRIRSDGVNYRVLNPLGVPMAAVVTKGGATYTQAGTTVTVSSGTSTWYPIVGGRVSLSITNRGSGYGMAPVVNIAAPPGPGVAATATATLSTNATIKSLTMVNEGAGYPSAPAVTITPSPFDTQVTTGAIVTATVQANLTGSGTVSAILCTNNGATLGSTVPTLTITGGNSSATATALLCTTVTAITANVLGSGAATAAALTTCQGQPTAVNVFQNPAVELTDFIPRPLQANISVGATGRLTTNSATIADGGMFLGTALGIVIPNDVQLQNGTITLTQGAVSDTVIIQPA